MNQLELSAKGKELFEKRRNLNAARVNDAARNSPAGSSRQSARIPLLSAVKRSAEEITLQREERNWRHVNRSDKQKDREEGNGAFSLHTSYR